MVFGWGRSKKLNKHFKLLMTNYTAFVNIQNINAIPSKIFGLSDNQKTLVALFFYITVQTYFKAFGQEIIDIIRNKQIGTNDWKLEKRHFDLALSLLVRNHKGAYEFVVAIDRVIGEFINGEIESDFLNNALKQADRFVEG